MRSGDVLASRFVIEQLAGRGGMGEVYRARDGQMDQCVAIKILRHDEAGDLARFDREVRILSEIKDPGVVQYVAHGTTPDGDPYLVMEWLDGEDLSQHLARVRLSPTQSVQICIAVAEALGALHDRGIVHRDLKPSNVFLVQGQTSPVKVLDLGIARVESSTRMTGTGTLIGTFGYMAPEQANGAKDIDARVDVFALGCLLFECITGEPAFGGTHPMAILTKILFEDAPRLSQWNLGIPGELDLLVRRMLSRNRDERPRNGRTVAEALRSFQDISDVARDETLEMRRAPALTDSELHSLAVILVEAPSIDSEAIAPEIAALAQTHGATLERLLDGSIAMMLSSKGMAADLLSQAARCALAIAMRVPGRRVVLSVGRTHGQVMAPMGPAIDQAGRLLTADAKEPGVVIIDDAAAGHLDARFEVRDESGVYVLAGERDIAEVRTLLGKPTPCVGRERELNLLRGFLDDCIGDEPRAQAVLVTALPGVGKSRLGREFLYMLDQRDTSASVWTARGEPLRAGSAFALAAQLVESAAGIQRGEKQETRQEKLRTRIASHVPRDKQRRVADFLGEMIGASFSDEDNLPLRAARVDAQLMSEQVRVAFGDFLAAECAANPTIIFLEDLHWGDAATVDVLGRALRDSSEKPLFVLALARPNVHEVFPTLWQSRHMQEIRMNELSKKAAERLVRHVLGPKVTTDTIQKIVNLSLGNAFYLEELIRAAAEHRGNDLPSTVVAMVQARIGSLSDLERLLLRAASIFGETCWSGGVSALLGDMFSAGNKVDEKLELLVEKELLIRRPESRFPHETEYVFRHALLREGAYSMLTDKDRELGHRLAGDWLECAGENDQVVLAEHFEYGGDRDKAAQLWFHAANRAGWSGSSNDGLRYLERALALQPAAHLRARLLGKYCELHVYRIEMVTRAEPHAQEVLQTIERGGEAWAQAQLVALICARLRGDLEAFQHGVAETMQAPIHAQNAFNMTTLITMMAAQLDMCGDVDTASRAFARLEAGLHALDTREPVTDAFYNLMRCLRMIYAHEDLLGGFRLSAATVHHTKSIGNAVFAHGAHIFGGTYALALGQYDTLVEVLDCQLEIDATMGVVTSVKPFVLAWALADSKEFQRAQEWAERLVTTAQQRKLAHDEARGHWIVGEIARRLGELDKANTEMQTSLAMLRQICPLDVPGALASLGALRLAQNRPEDALAAAEEGMLRMKAMSGACSQFFRNAFLRLVYAEALEACRKHDAAKIAIAEAHAWLQSIAAKIDDERFRTSFFENVPENRRILELAAQWR